MAARWRKLTDTQRSDLAADGSFVPVRDITFELLDTGDKGMVTIPLRNYFDTDFVAAEIQRLADAIEALGRRGG